MIVVGHETPRQNQETVPALDVAQCLNERFSFARIGEDVFSAGDSAVDVI